MAPPNILKMKKSISLIGMAGAGKSSIGKMLANYLKFGLVDSDQLIEVNQNKSLQEILVENGIQAVSYTHLTLPTICSV